MSSVTRKNRAYTVVNVNLTTVNHAVDDFIQRLVPIYWSVKHNVNTILDNSHIFTFCFIG